VSRRSGSARRGQLRAEQLAAVDSGSCRPPCGPPGRAPGELRRGAAADTSGPMANMHRPWSARPFEAQLDSSRRVLRRRRAS